MERCLGCDQLWHFRDFSVVGEELPVLSWGSSEVAVKAEGLRSGI